MHTEEMIKDMFYLFCLLCEARSASVFSVVQNGFLGGGEPALKAINLFTKRLRDAAPLERVIKQEIRRARAQCLLIYSSFTSLCATRS